MSNQYLKLRRSGVPGKIPSTSSIDYGEIALNTYDGVAYMKKSGSGGEEVVGFNSGSFSGSFQGNFSGSLYGTASWAENYNETDPVFTAVSGTFATTASFNAFTASYNTGSFTGSFIGIFTGIATTASYVKNAQTASYVQLAQSASYVQLAQTASYVENAQTASYVLNAISASYSRTASYVELAQTASNILGGKAPHVPFFITDTTLATSSIYQSGSSTVIINQDAATSANPEALYVWQPSTSSFNVISGKGNLDNYLQLNIQNTNQGPDASSDVVATANNGSEVDNYIDMGINSQNFTGFLGGANDSYLYSHGHNMWIGNVNDGYSLHLFNSSSINPLVTLTPSNTVDVNTTLNAPDITGSLEGTASWAKNVISASHAINSDFAGYAQTAGTAANGGVTKLIAGSGITLLPSNGLGNVTVIAGGGGGGVTILSGSNVTQSFSNASTWNFAHNLGIRTPVISVFDSNYNQVIPESIQLVDTSSAIITFPTLESGFAIATVGGVSGNAYSASYALFSTYADTASFAFETDPVFVAKSASLATTGSNIFRGTQTITGSVNISGSQTFIGTSAFYGNHTLSGSNTITGNTVMSGSIVVSGSSDFKNSTFIVTGSSFFKGTHQVSGSTSITGSFNVVDGDINIVSGSSFTRWGNKLFNYGQFSDTTTQSGSANTAYAMKFNTTDFALNTRIVSESRITVENTGIYNLQFSAQLGNTANTAIEFDIWFAYTGSNIPNSNTHITLNKVAGSLGRQVAAWNFAYPIQGGDYVEIYWSCDAATGQLQSAPTATTPTRPAVPSVIATLTQIA